MEGWMDAWMHAQIDEGINGGWSDGQGMADGWANTKTRSGTADEDEAFRDDQFWGQSITT